MKGENEAIGEAFEKCFAKKDSSGNVLYQNKKNMTLMKYTPDIYGAR